MGLQGTSWLRKRRPGLSLLLGLLFLGGGLRALAVSRFHFYTDSYNYMLMSQFFAQTGCMTGSLGSRGGSFIPSPSPVYKWAYPMVVALPVKLGMDPERAGRTVCASMGLATILLATSISRKLFGKVRHGAWGGLLMAVSYENVTWGGFVLADVPGLFWVFLSIWLLLVPKGAFFRFLAGVSLAAAGLSRTELCLVSIPLWLVVAFKEKKQPFQSILFLLSFLGVWTSVTLFFGARIPSECFQAGGTTPSLLDKVFGRFFELQRVDLHHVVTFVLAEGALCLGAMAGFLLWVRERRWKHCLLLGAYVAPLALIYNVSPNEHHRYYTQLLPALLIPAVYALGKGKDKLEEAGWLWKRTLQALPWLVCVGLFLQCLQISIRGHRESDYPQEAGRWMRMLLEEGKVNRYEILFCVEERAVYFYTGLSCREVSAQSPYLNAEGISKGETVLFLVDDYQVRPRMPGFVEFLERHPEASLVQKKESDALCSPVYQREKNEARWLYLFRVPGALALELSQGNWKRDDD